MIDRDQQFRLQRFWGATIFSLGVLWGFSSLAYSPITALTSIVGSSWFEVCVILAGGLLTFSASIGAFYRRSFASRVLLSGGSILLLVALVGQAFFSQDTHGPVNLLLLFLSGPVAISLGIFGEITERKGWPPLRGGR
jgi:hypothetical protein